MLGLFVAQPALAAHDLAFQLDGDVDHTTTTSVGGATQAYDWDSFFGLTGSCLGTTGLATCLSQNTLTATQMTDGFTNLAGVVDFRLKGTAASPSFDTSDRTTFATGSKDTLNITPGWQC
ncbi:MAG: hypothetical protein E6G61_10385, partial [Actinobacteria bacterium]